MPLDAVGYWVLDSQTGEESDYSPIGGGGASIVGASLDVIPGPIPPEPPLEPCPPVVAQPWCAPEPAEVCVTPTAPGLPADCECIFFDDGLTVFDGGLTVFVCPDGDLPQEEDQEEEEEEEEEGVE